MNILIFIDHEIIFRNFIHPGVFDEKCKEFNVKFIFPEKNNKRFADLDLKKFKLPAPLLDCQLMGDVIHYGIIDFLFLK